MYVLSWKRTNPEDLLFAGTSFTIYTSVFSRSRGFVALEDGSRK